MSLSGQLVGLPQEELRRLKFGLDLHGVLRSEPAEAQLAATCREDSLLNQPKMIYHPHTPLALIRFSLLKLLEISLSIAMTTRSFSKVARSVINVRA